MNKQSKGVFIIIKGKNCGFCTAKLDPVLPQFYKRFEAEGIDIVEYVTEFYGVNKDKNGKTVYPESLGHIPWAPFMAFTDHKTWEAIKKGADMRKDIHVVNFTFSGESYVAEENDVVYPFDPNLIINWINTRSNKPKEPEKEVLIDSNPFLPSNGKKKNILEINYCNIKIVPKCGRA